MPNNTQKFLIIHTVILDNIHVLIWRGVEGVSVLQRVSDAMILHIIFHSNPPPIIFFQINPDIYVNKYIL